MAAREQHSVLIDQPLEEVFAYITDVNNNSLWQSSTLETEQTSEGPIGVGTTYRSVSKFLGPTHRDNLRGHRARASSQAVCQGYLGTHTGCWLLPARACRWRYPVHANPRGGGGRVL